MNFEAGLLFPFSIGLAVFLLVYLVWSVLSSDQPTAKDTKPETTQAGKPGGEGDAQEGDPLGNGVPRPPGPKTQPPQEVAVYPMFSEERNSQMLKEVLAASHESEKVDLFKKNEMYEILYNRHQKQKLYEKTKENLPSDEPNIKFTRSAYTHSRVEKKYVEVEEEEYVIVGKK